MTYVHVVLLANDAAFESTQRIPSLVIALIILIMRMDLFAFL